MMKKMTVLFCAVLVLGLASGVSALITETFDTGLGNWTDHDVSNSLPGWSNSNNAGGASGPGEWGGTIVRNSCPTRPWVGDDTIGTITYQDSLALKFTYKNIDISDGDRDPHVMFGYIDSTGANVTGAVLWLQLHRWSDGPGTSGLKLYVGTTMVDHWGYNHNTVSTVDLSYVYDSGSGNATVTGTVTGTSAGTRTINKTAVAAGTADALGLYLETSTSEGNPGRRRNWYIDDVTYTPEPATIALLGLGGLALLRRRR